MATDVFQPITNPITGETFKCVSFDQRAYVMEWTLEPKGYVPVEHVHPRQEEVFLVKEGELSLHLDGKEAIVKAGESITVPKGSRHIAYNQTNNVVKCIVEYRPGLDHRQMFQCFGGLILDQDYNAKGEINVPKMGFLLKRMNCQAVMRPSNIPAPVFGIVLNVFYLIGMMKGWNRDFVRYTGQER